MNVTEKECPEFSALPPEAADAPDETNGSASFDYSPLDGRREFDSQEGVPDSSIADSQKKKRRQQNFLLQYAAIALSVVIVTSSFGGDILGEDRVFSSSGESTSISVSVPEGSVPEDSVPQVPPQQSAAIYPDRPPELGNQAPFYDFGECFIYTKSATEGAKQTLIDNQYRYSSVPMYQVEGLTYYGSMNTLVLDNLKLDTLSLNLLGNSLTLELRGTSEIEHLVVYGFYYGGSLTVTGDGALYINRSNSYDYGILLDSEYSDSYLYVESGPTLEINGKETAVAITHTGLEEPFILSADMKVSGGELLRYEFAYYFACLGNDEPALDDKPYYSYGFVNEDIPSRRITISPGK